MKILQTIKARYQHLSFHPMDYTVFGYLAFLGLLIIPFHNDVPDWPKYPVLHLIWIVAILELIRLAAVKQHPVLTFFRTFYPALGLGIAWMELNSLVTMIFPYWANDFVVNMDLAIFGVHPTV
ncbi:hypothetical protein BVY01_04945, partial [bacterium I07]